MWTRIYGLPDGQTLFLSRLFCRFAPFGCASHLQGRAGARSPAHPVAETLALGGACTGVAGPRCSSSRRGCGKRSADLGAGPGSGRGHSGPALTRLGRHCRVPAASGQHASPPVLALGAFSGKLRGGRSQLQPEKELAGEQREWLLGAIGDCPRLGTQRPAPERADPGRAHATPSIRSVLLWAVGEMAWLWGFRPVVDTDPPSLGHQRPWEAEVAYVKQTVCLLSTICGDSLLKHFKRGLTFLPTDRVAVAINHLDACRSS